MFHQFKLSACLFLVLGVLNLGTYSQVVLPATDKTERAAETEKSRSSAKKENFPIPQQTKSKPQTKKSESDLSKFFRNIFDDQKDIWTSPFRIKKEDAKYLVPIGLITTGLIATDRRTSAKVGTNGSLPPLSKSVSYAGWTGVVAGSSAALYLYGRARKNQRLRETGFLAMESLVNSMVVTQALKWATQRPRPNEDGGRGRFFKGGSSFPSGHSSNAWSVATVIAQEYQEKPWVKYGAYAAATAVSLSRYSGRKHFLSDIFIGSALGYGIGRFVYKKRHIDSQNTEENKTTNSKLIPQIIPLFERKTATYGGALSWNF